MWYLPVTTPEAIVEFSEPGRMALRLVVTDRLAVGRLGDGLLLTNDEVSRHHCQLQLRDGTLWIEDLGSSNGTFVNGRRVVEETPLAEGDEVGIGAATMAVVAVGVPSPDGRVSVGGTPAPGGQRSSAVPTSGTPGASGGLVPDERELRASVVGGTITMVFSDIVGSTLLNASMGDRSWITLLERHNEILRTQLDRFTGTEIKGQGDGFILTFPSARHALLFAIASQRDLQACRDQDDDFVVHVRMGVHTGEVIQQGGDLFGRHVNLAARVAAAAGSDEILVSRLVFELASPMGDIGFGPPLAVPLKGLDGSHELLPVRWHRADGS